MTPEALEKMKILGTMTTPGPWRVDPDDEIGGAYNITEAEQISTREDHDNARFIAAARTFVPQAIDHLEQQRLRIGILEAALGYYADELNYPAPVAMDFGARARRALNE